MKTFVRIFLVLVLLLVLAAGGAYFVITQPAFQKKLIESRLPAGSSIGSAQVSTGSLELTDLQVMLADGTAAKLDSLRSDFSPWAAVFDRTIKLRGLTVEGLVIKLPEAREGPASGEQSESGVSSTSGSTQTQTATEQPGSPTEALYALGEIDWLLDIDSIDLDGALVDASRNRYSFDLKSGRIAPGEETTIAAALKLESKEALQGGLKDFNSDAELTFTQKKSGGFEQLHLSSQTSGSDAQGNAVISISQRLGLSINSFEESAELAMSFNADLPHPEAFAPELATLQGLSLKGELKGSAEGSALTLLTADFDAASNGAQVVMIKLKQALTLGAQQKFVGELMEINLINLPLAWINPWLTNGVQLSGAPLSAQIALSGKGDGVLEVRTLEPLQVGPFSLWQKQQSLLEEVTIRMNPQIRVEESQTIRYDLGDFQLLDRYGDILRGTVSGSKQPSDGSSPLAGLQAQARLDVGLAELLQQPALSGLGSVMAGQAQLALDLNGAAETPVQLQADITGLRSRDFPGTRQDYRLAAQLKEADSWRYAFGLNFAAGPESRPSTRIELGGHVNPDTQPLAFQVKLTSPRVEQRDLDLLMAALKPSESGSDVSVSNPTTPASGTSAAGSSPPRISESGSRPPPWADLSGEVSISIDELTLQSGQSLTGINAQAKISEALLAISDIKATLQGGGLSGNAEVLYDPSLNEAYKVSSTLKFQNMDPSIFSKKSSGGFPVNGLFDGDFNQSGRGATLEQALDDSEGNLHITGRDGMLTAFELDNRSQIGLLGASILGQSMNRPGITAVAQAIPYFNQMKFDHFTLKLVRAQDKKVRIPELTFIGDHLRLNGQGFIAASTLGQVLDQPLDLTLSLGAKGQLIDYLETLQLLGPAMGEDGFRNWNQNINIGGTLSNPDTSALREMLNSAARRALEKPKSGQAPATEASPPEGERLLPGENDGQNPEPPTEPKKKTKDEKRRDDIEMGLDLLNSVFG